MAEATPSMKEIFENLMNANINPDVAKKINSIYQFKVTGNEPGEWIMDLTKDNNWVSPGTSDKAKCTITVGGEEWKQILLKQLDPTKAFFNGKLKVNGDINMAMKLQQLLNMSAPGTSPSTPPSM